MSDQQGKPWGVYTVDGHTLIDRYADFAQANARKLRMTASGVPCLVSNKPPYGGPRSVAEKPLRAD